MSKPLTESELQEMEAKIGAAESHSGAHAYLCEEAWTLLHEARRLREENARMEREITMNMQIFRDYSIANNGLLKWVRHD